MPITIQDNGKNNQIEIAENTIAASTGIIIINGNNNKLKIGEHSVLTNIFIESGGDNASITIGKKCFLFGEFRCLTHNTHIIIGDNTTMMGVRLYLHEEGEINIGNDCMFSSGIIMDVSDMHSIIDLKTNKRINYAQNITIANHVWLGFDVYILKGITIGSNAIVGAKSIVTKDVPDNTLVAGVPAKKIKSGITWDRKCIPK